MPQSARKALDNLADALVEDILNASDEEILEEFREDHGDPERHAAEMRALFERAVEQARERRKKERIAMFAGRLLDTLVADRVMGWKTFAGEPGYGRPPGKLSLVLNEVPPYSTDIAAAWQVVEHLERTMWALSLHRSTDDNGFLAEGWQAIFTDPEASYHAAAPTAPHAICLAALMVAGVDV